MITNDTFSGKTAIVTGAGQGIGFEICRQLCSHGASVILNDIETELADNAAARIREEGGNCFPLPGDSSDLNCIDEMIGTAVSKFGKVDIVIANAGITLFAGFFDYSPESFERVVKVNLFGSFFFVQAAAKQFRAQKSGGRVLLMSSVTGHQAHENLAAYGMTKAALEMLAKNLVIELSPYNITINAVAPGATLTERTVSDKDYAKTWSKLTPIGRPASPQDIANAALFLVSPAAGHITGQTLIIDGGWTSTSPSPYEH